MAAPSVEDKLAEVVSRGDLEGLRALADARVSLETRLGRDRATIAHIAAKLGDLTMLRWIVERAPRLLLATDEVRVGRGVKGRLDVRNRMAALWRTGRLPGDTSRHCNGW